MKVDNSRIEKWQDVIFPVRFEQATSWLLPSGNFCSQMYLHFAKLVWIFVGTTWNDEIFSKRLWYYKQEISLQVIHKILVCIPSNNIPQYKNKCHINPYYCPVPGSVSMLALFGFFSRHKLHRAHFKPFNLLNLYMLYTDKANPKLIQVVHVLHV